MYTEDLNSYDASGYYIAIIDGRRCANWKHFLQEIGIAFQFPRYYGVNMNALSECINDLDWLAAENYLLVIKNSAQLLCEEPEAEREYVRTFFEAVIKEWDSVPNYDGEDAYRKRADFRVLWE